MVILRTFAALAAGFVVILLLGMAATALVARLTPSWNLEAAAPEPEAKPKAPKAVQRQCSPGAVIVHLGALFLAAAAGGYVTAWASDANSLIHVLALGIIVLALGALSALQSRGKLPIWLQLAQVAISPIGVLAGGLMRLRVLGIL